MSVLHMINEMNKIEWAEQDMDEYFDRRDEEEKIANMDRWEYEDYLKSMK